MKKSLACGQPHSRRPEFTRTLFGPRCPRFLRDALVRRIVGTLLFIFLWVKQFDSVYEMHKSRGEKFSRKYRIGHGMHAST